MYRRDEEKKLSTAASMTVIFTPLLSLLAAQRLRIDLAFKA